MWEAGIASGNIPPGIHAALRDWTDRNVTRFSQPQQSGDDYHETAAAYLVLRQALVLGSLGQIQAMFLGCKKTGTQILKLDAALGYFRQAGFAETKVLWHKKLWALLSATK